MGKKELLKEVEEAAASKIPDPETMPSEKKRKKAQGTTSKEDANIQFAAMSEEEQLASLSAALESDSGDKKGTASASAEVGAGDPAGTKRKKKEKEAQEAPEKETKKSKKAEKEKGEKGETASKKAEAKQKSAKAAPKSAVGLAASFAKGKSGK